MSIKIMLACAYCYQSVQWTQGAIELRNAKSGRVIRSAQFTEIQCPHCDSKFVVDINTRRKSKGRRLKALEAKQKAVHDAKVREAEAANEIIAARLLAEPGCDCAATYKKQREHGNYGYGDREDGLRPGGYIDGNIPRPPEHRYYCPCHPSQRRAS